MAKIKIPVGVINGKQRFINFDGKKIKVMEFVDSISEETKYYTGFKGEKLNYYDTKIDKKPTGKCDIHIMLSSKDVKFTEEKI